jgi:hypothetical protein
MRSCSTRSRSSAGRDLELAPDVRGGFEMILLRMLAFRHGRGRAGATFERRAAGEE